MLITRFIDEGLCINRQQFITVHALSENGVTLYMENRMDDSDEVITVLSDECLEIGEYGTMLYLHALDYATGNVTFRIEHDENVKIHREEGSMQ